MWIANLSFCGILLPISILFTIEILERCDMVCWKENCSCFVYKWEVNILFNFNFYLLLHRYVGKQIKPLYLLNSFTFFSYWVIKKFYCNNSNFIKLDHEIMLKFSYIIHTSFTFLNKFMYLFNSIRLM